MELTKQKFISSGIKATLLLLGIYLLRVLNSLNRCNHTNSLNKNLAYSA